MAMKKAACLVLLLIACTATTRVARGGDAKHKAPAKDPSIGWDSIWYLQCKVETSTSVPAFRLKGGGSIRMVVFHFWYGEGQCTTGSDAPQSRKTFLTADVSDSGYVHGMIHFCTTDKVLAAGMKLPAVFDCIFDGKFDPKTDTIDGDATGEYWHYPVGHPELAARDSSQDPTIHVTLKLKGGKGDHPQAPPDTSLPTPTPDWRGAINNPIISGIKGVVAGERNKNQSGNSGLPGANPTSTPDGNPFLGVRDTLDVIMSNLYWVPSGAPATPPAPSSPQH